MPNPTSVRERIVRATLQIIADDGVTQITNRRIAETAGVSLGSVTYHFATQRDLLRESLHMFVEQETRRFAELASYPCDSAADLTGLAGVIDHIVAAATGSENIAAYELYLQASRDPQLRTAAEECFSAYDRLAASLLDVLGVKDAERLAPPLVAMVIGLQLRRLATTTESADGQTSTTSADQGAGPVTLKSSSADKSS